MDSSKYDYLFSQYAEGFDIPFAWLKGIAQAESSLNPRAYRYEAKINDASYGLMQILYGTAKGLGYDGPAEGLYDPDTNVALGAQLISDLINRYGLDFNAVYSAYNSGSPTLYRRSSQVQNNVTRAWNFVDKILESVVYDVEQTESEISDILQSQGIDPMWIYAGIGIMFLLAISNRKGVIA
jgi:soluble lytic murein transglycosylase-like protein